VAHRVDGLHRSHHLLQDLTAFEVLRRQRIGIDEPGDQGTKLGQILHDLRGNAGFGRGRRRLVFGSPIDPQEL